MRIFKAVLLAVFLVLGAFPSAMAQTEPTAVPYPSASTPAAIDRGEFTESDTTPISVTLTLSLTDRNAAESLLKSLNTPGDPLFHQFLTADQFAARFAPAQADVAKVIASLAKYGLTAQQTTATTLQVTGLPAALERAFSVSLHNYEVPAHGRAAGYSYHAPLTAPTIPAEISSAVSAVVGLDTRPSFRPLHVVSPHPLSRPPSVKPATGNPFGLLTVTDFANYYDVDPLYNRGVTGSGRTLGIMTLASFTPSDAYTYWSAVGLAVNSNRIRIVNIDGGPGAPSDASGSDETTLDVEQSGGVAPGADIIVYQAPNTNQGFVDLFAAAIEANRAETLSVSWGEWEWGDNFQNGAVTDPLTGRTVASTQAIHELLVRAALQGQTVFAASGDGGAYDADDSFGDCYPTGCSSPLSVDYPASDTAITAGGGTTLPGTQEYCLNAACTPPYYVVKIPQERVWGWDYLEGLCTVLGLNPFTCGIYPVGSGGGVSVTYLIPSYQAFLPAVQRSQPGQSFTLAGQLLYVLPSYFPGRNVPDVSFNADPQTGYVIYYTSDVNGFEYESAGGTSFVAPQLNGVSALLGQYLNGSRLGLLNYPLYGLAQTGHAYGKTGAPLNAIAYGDNWFYHGSNGYNPAAGLGTLNVWNFAQDLRGWF